MGRRRTYKEEETLAEKEPSSDNPAAEGNVQENQEVDYFKEGVQTGAGYYE